MATLVIDNFKGSMTSKIEGNINSGFSNIITTFAHDVFTKPGNLTWCESAEQIDPNQTVITDMIVAGKTRVESGVNYVYAIGHTGRLYKIQSNDPTTYNPDYDNPFLLTTLTINSPTFKRGGFIEFYGSTEKIYIGHDKGVTSVNFNGTGEAFVGVQGSWTQDVPRPFIQFLGNLYVGNGTNIAEISVGAIVNTYTKLSPAFPINTQVRDLDVTPDGTYLMAVVAEQALSDITATTPDTTIVSPSDSFVFRWNGVDAGYTSFTTYASTVLSSNIVFGNQQYLFGYDFLGGAVYNGSGKLITSLPGSPYGESPFPNAVSSMGDFLTWSTLLPFEGILYMVFSAYGLISQYDSEVNYWSPLSQAGTGDETDVLHVPFQLLVSDFAQGASTNGYTDQLFGNTKLYFSTIETSADTVKYKLYKWRPVPTSTGTVQDGALYQTQNQLFSKKVKINEVRIYGEPWVTGNAFTIDLIGSNQEPMSGGSKTFTAGSNLTIGDDFAWYTPQMAPTYTLGLRVTNAGTTNHVITKVEIDFSEGGK